MISKNSNRKKLQGWQDKGRGSVTRAQEPGPPSRNPGCLSGCQVGARPREEASHCLQQKPGSNPLFLPPLNSHPSLPLAESNRKPVNKDTWEM